MAVSDTLADGAGPYLITMTALNDVWDGQTASGGSAANERRIKLTGIRWVGTSVAATDRCVIQNRAGHTIWDSYHGTAAGVGFTVESKIFKELTYVDYLKVSTLGSGTVYFYYE